MPALESKSSKPTKKYRYDNFPCLVRHGETIEKKLRTHTTQEKNAIDARNALRHLTYEKNLKGSGLISWKTIKALFIKRDDDLLAALRDEMEYLFDNAANKISQMDESAQRRLEIFINNLLSVYPFVDPKNNETVVLPQRDPLTKQWENVTYRFKRIDISPQKGFLAWLLDDEDRLYATALEPTNNPNAKPHLLLMGTTYPTCQGADLNHLYNHKPGTTVGEGHDLTKVAEWLEANPNAKVCGHSKGGSMAIMIGAKFKQWVSEIHSLNPTALHSSTIKRIIGHWVKVIKDYIDPIMNVYTQAGDPVFLLDHNFLPNTDLFVFKKPNLSRFKIAIHANYYSGTKEISIGIVKPEAIINSKTREFFTDLKTAANLVLFPLLYTNLCLKQCVRKAARRFDKTNNPLYLLLGILPGAVYLGTATATVGLLLSALLLSTLVSSIKIGIKSLFSCAPSSAQVVPSTSKIINGAKLGKTIDYKSPAQVQPLDTEILLVKNDIIHPQNTVDLKLPAPTFSRV